jgi:5'-3' exoribonuclease 2
MGHIGEKRLRAMHNKGMVEGFLDCNLEFDFWEHSINGKPNWVIFPYRATKKKGIMELIHSDMFGHVLVPSLGGSLYYVSFIDYFSRKEMNIFPEEEIKGFREVQRV